MLQKRILHIITLIKSICSTIQKIYVTVIIEDRIRDELRSFITNIKTEFPEEQHNLLKRYLSFVISDPVSNGFKLKYIIRIRSTFSEGSKKIILEKVIYFEIN